MSFSWQRRAINHYKYWSYKNRWGRYRWRPTADSATLAHAIHKKRMRTMAMRILRNMGPLSVAPVAVDIVNNFNNPNNGTGQRAWPEISGYPPVFGNFIGEIGHTGGGSYIWTGFSWEPAILGG